MGFGMKLQKSSCVNWGKEAGSNQYCNRAELVSVESSAELRMSELGGSSSSLGHSNKQMCRVGFAWVCGFWCKLFILHSQ